MVIYNAFKLKATKKRTQIELLGPMHNMVPNGIVHRDDFFFDSERCSAEKPEYSAIPMVCA